MYENKNQKLISRRAFHSRVLRNVMIFLLILTVSLLIGISGYHYIGELNWVDSFLEACMILGGMGPVSAPKNDAVKIFAGFYAIFCGVIFLSGISLLISPFWHRELHRFHLADDDKEENKKSRKSK